MTEPVTTLDQQRAKHAWDVVCKLKDLDNAGDFQGDTKKLPPQIVWSGLGNSLAFLKAKGKNKLHEALSSWINKRMPDKNGNRDLLERIINSDAEFYEIDRKPTPDLQEIIEDYENDILRRYLEKDRPFYREGSRFYMRPWYFINNFHIFIKNTHQISIVALGGKIGVYIPNQPGSSHCSDLINNRKLYLSDPSYSGRMKYIRSQDFAWFLNFIAPEPQYPRQ